MCVQKSRQYQLFRSSPFFFFSVAICSVWVWQMALKAYHPWPHGLMHPALALDPSYMPLHKCFCFAVQEESKPQCQQEEGQPEGPATSWPLDPSWGDGDEEHGESTERCPIWTRLTHPVLPGPPTGRTQPIGKSDRQQEQPLRYFGGIMLKPFWFLKFVTQVFLLF